MNNITIRITFKGYEEFGKVVAVPVNLNLCSACFNGVATCIFRDTKECPHENVAEEHQCHKIVFVKYEGKW